MINLRHIFSLAAVALSAAILALSLTYTPDTPTANSSQPELGASQRSKTETFEVDGAPVLPPDVTLDVGGTGTDTEIPGKLEYYSWVFDNKVRVLKPSPPVEWPDAVSVSYRRDVTFDLDTAKMPQHLDILLHDGVDEQGLPSESDLKPLSCVSGVVEGEAPCDVRKNRDREGDWNVSLPVRSCASPCYVVIYGSWMLEDTIQSEGQTPPAAENAASWFFTVSNKVD